MPITSEIDPKNDLSIFTAEGNPSFDKFMAAVKLFYAGEPTRNVLWNLDQASVRSLSGQHIKKT